MNKICVIGNPILKISDQKIFFKAHCSGTQGLSAARLSSQVDLFAQIKAEDKELLQSVLDKENISFFLCGAVSKAGGVFCEMIARHFEGRKMQDLFLADGSISGEEVAAVFEMAAQNRRFTVLSSAVQNAPDWQKSLPYTSLLMMETLHFERAFGTHEQEALKKFDRAKGNLLLLTDGLSYCKFFDGETLASLPLEMLPSTDVWGAFDVFVGALCHRLSLIQYVDVDILLSQIPFAIKAAQNAASKEGGYEKFPYSFELMTF